MKTVACPECFETFHLSIEMAKGSPLNLALIAHWDGWQPFGTSFRGCGSFEVSITNMTKRDRCYVEEVYVVGFVPCSDLPKDLPEYLDPFLKPLADDLSKGFISGYNIPYPLQFSSGKFHSSGIENIQLLLLCWTGDHPGQCEVGKFLNQGKCGCTISKTTASVSSGYPNTEKQMKARGRRPRCLDTPMKHEARVLEITSHA